MLTKQNSIPHHTYDHYRNIINSEVGRANKLYYKEAFVPDTIHRKKNPQNLVKSNKN